MGCYFAADVWCQYNAVHCNLQAFLLISVQCARVRVLVPVRSVVLKSASIAPRQPWCNFTPTERSRKVPTSFLMRGAVCSQAAVPDGAELADVACLGQFIFLAS